MDTIQRAVVKRSAHRTASVNGSKVLDCDVPYPGKIYLEYIITWRKQGIEVPIFIQFNGFPPHFDTKYLGRVRLVDKASIELKNIVPSDEGWYECSIVFIDGTDRSNQNGTWVYLSVHSEYTALSVAIFRLYNIVNCSITCCVVLMARSLLIKSETGFSYCWKKRYEVKLDFLAMTTMP